MQEQENMTLGQEQENSTENVSRETKSDLTITFEPKYGDIFDAWIRPIPQTAPTANPATSFCWLPS